jgi:hypothetical protein
LGCAAALVVVRAKAARQLLRWALWLAALDLAKQPADLMAVGRSCLRPLEAA